MKWKKESYQRRNLLENLIESNISIGKIFEDSEITKFAATKMIC